MCRYLNYFEFVEDYVSKLNAENNNLNHETAKSYNLLISEKFRAYSTLLIAKLNQFEFDKSAFLIEKTNGLIEILNKSTKLFLFFHVQVLLSSLFFIHY